MQLVTTQATMSSLEISELVESRHDKVRQSIDRLVARGVITLPPMGVVSNTGMGPSEITVYELCKRDSYVVVAQLCPEFTARLVDRWQELENARPAFDPAIALPQDYIQALEQLLITKKSEQAAITQRDHAIATKAQIGSKREATAMAAVARANKEVAKLKDQLGFSVRQATILQVEDAAGADFDFLPLRRWCNAHEVVAESVPDKRYPKGVKAWPAAAWDACYGVDLSKLFADRVGA